MSQDSFSQYDTYTTNPTPTIDVGLRTVKSVPRVDRMRIHSRSTILQLLDIGESFGDNVIPARTSYQLIADLKQRRDSAWMAEISSLLLGESGVTCEVDGTLLENQVARGFFYIQGLSLVVVGGSNPLAMLSYVDKNGRRHDYKTYNRFRLDQLVSRFGSLRTALGNGLGSDSDKLGVLLRGVIGRAPTRSAQSRLSSQFPGFLLKQQMTRMLDADWLAANVVEEIEETVVPPYFSDDARERVRSPLPNLALVKELRNDVVTFQGAKVLRPTFDDVCVRLMRLGFVGFKEKARHVWASRGTSDVQKYKAVCDYFGVTPYGSTDAIPHISGVLQVCRGRERKVLEYLTGGSGSDLPVMVRKKLDGVLPNKDVVRMLQSRLGVAASQVHFQSDRHALGRLPLEEAFRVYSRGPSKVLDATHLATKIVGATASFMESHINAVARWFFHILDIPFRPMELVEIHLLGKVLRGGDVRDSLVLLTTGLGTNFMTLFGYKIHDLLGFLDYIVRGTEDPVVYQSFEPFKWLKMARGSPMWAMFGAVVYQTIATKFAGSTEPTRAASEFIRFVGDSTVEAVDFTLAWSDLIGYFADRARVAWEKGDLSLFFEPDPVSKALREIQEILNVLHDKQFQGDPKLTVANGKRLIGTYARSTNSHVVRKLKELTDAIEVFEGSLLNKRQMPLGVIITGKPGLGKTTFVMEFESILKRVLGIPDDGISITHTFTHTKHQVLPPVVHIALENDAFSNVDRDFMQTRGQSMMDHYQTLCDTTTYRVEAASIEEKKNSNMEPSFVFVTTNAPGFYAACTANGYDKLDRRYLILEFLLDEDKYAADHSIPKEDAHAHFVKRRNEAPFSKYVHYRLGWMRNKDATISFAIDTVVKETRESHEIIKILFEQKKLLKKGGATLSRENKCSGCLMSTGCLCSSFDDLRVHLQYLPGTEYLDGLVELLQVPVPLWFVTLILIFSSLVVLQAAKIVRDSAESIYAEFTKSAMGIAKEVEEAYNAKVAGMTKATAAGVGVALFVYLGCTIARTYILTSKLTVTEQGAHLTTLVNVPSEKPEAPTQFYGAKVPWLNNLIHNDVFVIRRQSTGGLIRGSFVHSRVMMTNRHFFDEKNFMEGEEFVLELPTGNFVWEYREECVHKSLVKDVAFVYVANVPVIATTVFGRMPKNDTLIEGGYCLGQRVPGPFVRRGFSSVTFGVIKSVDGDCGNLWYGPRGEVLGLFTGHVGRPGQPDGERPRLVTTICSKDVTEALKHFRLELQVDFEDVVADNLPPTAVKQMKRAKMGLHPKSPAAQFDKWDKPIYSTGHIPLFHYPIKETFNCNVSKTPLYAVFEGLIPEMAAASGKKAVCVGDPQDPKSWVGAYLKRLRCFEMVQINPKAYSAGVKGALRDVVSIDRRTPLDLRTTLLGSPLHSLINARDLDKAIGEPAKLLGGLTKHTIFRMTPEGFMVDQWFLDEVARILAMVKGDGPLEPTYVKACRKSEIKEKTKADRGDCRFFYVGCIAFNAVCRMYLLPLITWIYEHPEESGVYATVNAGSAEWKRIYDHLSELSHKWMELDHSSMDCHHWGAMPYYVAYMSGLATKLGYTPEEVRVVQRIFCMANNYVIDLFGEVMFMRGMLWSGRCDTLTCNSIIQKIVIYGILYEEGIVDGNGLIDGDMPRALVRMANTGDDNVTSLDQTIMGRIDTDAFVNGFKRWGYVVTNATKDGKVGFKDREDVEYLKRKFVVAELEGVEVVLAPLQEKSILKSLMYALDRDPNDAAINRSTIQCAALEYFLHGEEKYNWFKVKIASSIYADLQLPTYASLVERYLSGNFATWVDPDTGIELEPFERVTSLDDGEVVVHYQSGGRAPHPDLNGNNSWGIFIATELNEFLNVDKMGVDASPVPTLVEQLVSAGPTEQLAFLEEKDQTDFRQFSSVERLVFPGILTGTYNFQPIVSWMANPTVAAVMGNYRFYRYSKCRVKFVWTGSPQLYGKCRFYAYPAPSSADRPSYSTQGIFAEWPSSASDTNYSTTSQLPHVDVDFSKEGYGELVLPWISVNEWGLPGSTTEWMVVLAQLNPMATVDGSTPPNLAFQAYCSVEDFETKVLQAGEAMSLSMGLKYASRLAALIPHPVTQAFSKVASLGSEVAGHLGFSRLPTVPGNMVVSRRLDNPNVIDGQADYSYTLGVNDFQMSSMLERDVDDLYELVRRKSQIRCNWMPSSTIATAYDEMALVDPGIFVNTDRNDETVGTYMRPPIVSYFSHMFDYWSGEMEICVEVVASPLVKGRIGVVIVPPGTPKMTAFPTNGKYKTTIIEVCGTTCTDIVIPYNYKEFVSTVEWLPCAPSIPYTNHTRVQYFWLQAPIGWGGGSLPKVNLYLGAGKDFALAIPTLFDLNTCDIRFQGAAKAKVAKVYGEDVVSLHALAKRRTFYRTYGTPVGGAEFPVFDNDPMNPGDHVVPFYRWISACFLKVRGSVVWYIQPMNGTAVAYESRQTSLDRDESARGSLIISSDGGEIRIPYRGTGEFFYGFANTGLHTLNIQAPDNTVVNLATGAADDFSFSMFLSTPLLLMRT